MDKTEFNAAIVEWFNKLGGHRELRAHGCTSACLYDALDEGSAIAKNDPDKGIPAPAAPQDTPQEPVEAVSGHSEDEPQA